MPEPSGTQAEVRTGREERRAQWKVSVLGSMADYFDAGVILATGAAMPLWATAFGLGSFSQGLLATLGPNALSAGIGALFGGWIADKVGRKFVYKYDLLLFAFGVLWLVCAVDTTTLIIGSIITGLAIGIDLPASWALIGESVPKSRRGRFMGLTNVFWAIGPVVTLSLAGLLAPLGMLGIRIVFAHLLVVALVTWLLRRGMTESAVWQDHRARQARPDGRRPANLLSGSLLRASFTGRTGRTLFGLLMVYVLWQLTAGTNGIFLPTILQTFGAQSQGASVLIQALGFLCQAISCALVFMPLVDRKVTVRPGIGTVNPRWIIFGFGALAQIVAFFLLGVTGITTGIALANVILFGVGVGMSHDPLVKTLFQEQFPTEVRATAQGIVVAATRFVLAAWYFVLPLFEEMGIDVTAFILVGFLVLSSAIALLWRPRPAY
ncbi:MFS transporter [Amycolatopsis jiangsuensis]|uniref:Inositol transporter-like SP family MFS transporter n=1 Tax=Amycolatopsis jiangsuensis TaxID=1181879 RepID=A0A840INZ2_9PSEU|nr:MFS transporter [Amycolatopsis jiangsuensis]MBB4683165.1 inositol transporter-like SP family MFS transporter [Amycolatopsis jiangsuensis]